MKRSLALSLLLLFLQLPLWAQKVNVEFTSQTEARFFFYLNGKLLNEKSVGHVVIPNLDAQQRYHLRIVVDDPYAVTLTKTLRPDPRHNAFDLTFNPVRERILIRRSFDGGTTGASYTPAETTYEAAPSKERHRQDRGKSRAPRLRHQADPAPATTTGAGIKTNKF